MLFERSGGRGAGSGQGGRSLLWWKKHEQEKEKEKSSEPASGQSGGLRRSARSRKRRSDPVFFWNFQDTYVLALDEISAPTMTHCLIADRMKKQKLAHMLKLV
jgi:hypothetical protein